LRAFSKIGVGDFSATNNGTSNTAVTLFEYGVIQYYGFSKGTHSHSFVGGVYMPSLSIASTKFPMTSNLLNIGTASRTTAGGIYIGTGSGATVNPIFIGGAGSATTINGSCTFSKNITLPTTPSLPTINQIGYTVFVLTDFATLASSTANVVTNISSAIIPAGTFIVHFSGGGAFNGVYNMGISTTSATYNPKYTIGATTVVAFSNNHTKPAMTVVIQNTAITTWYLVHGSPSAGYDSQRINWYYTRIA
jgi:hypothetical protein